VIKKQLKLFGEDFQQEELEVTHLQWEPEALFAENLLDINGSMLLEFTSNKIDYLLTITGNGLYMAHFFDAKGVAKLPAHPYNLSECPLMRIRTKQLLLRSLEDSLHMVKEVKYMRF
jgi:hypothetical protein